MAFPDANERGEELRGHIGWPVVTGALVLTNLVSWFVVAWLYDLPLLGPHNSYSLLPAGALSGDLLRAGEWWRVITSQFLHVRLIHLAFNLGALLLLGAPWERSSGPLRFAVLYIVSGSVGQIVGVLAEPALVSTGASQAVMAVAGARATELLKRREGGLVAFIVPAIVVFVQLTLDILAAGKFKAGHWSGLCAGAIVGYLLSHRPK